MTSPYMNSAEAAIYLRFVTADGEPDLRRLRDWMTRYAVPAKKRGRSVLIDKADLESALEAR